MSTRPRRRALLIGTERYQDERFAQLPCTRADTTQLDEVLRHPAIGGFHSVTLLQDKTSTEFRTAIEEFLGTVHEDELALLYVSGHGTRLVQVGGEFYFINTDTQFDDIARTAVNARFVNDHLEDCYASQKVVLLDCCQSGGFISGFQTSERPTAKSANTGTEGLLPLVTRGVYVLSSSAPDEASFGGGGTVEAPEPSVFTGAMIDTLLAGGAGASESGEVTVDELCRTVQRKLQGGRQTPLSSSLHVSGDIYLASRPKGPVQLAVAPRPPSPTTPIVASPTRAAPGWSELLGYYLDTVRAEESSFELMPVRGNGYACLPGSERILLGDVDHDGCIAIPASAQALVKRVIHDRAELWAGWPAVMISAKQREFAPLLIRRVEVETNASGTMRLRPDGTVAPHPGLLRRLLDDDREVLALCATYEPSWHTGESDRLAADAAHLLREELGVQVVEKLRPDALSGQLPESAPGDGAFNVGVLFAESPGGYTRSLTKDLTKIRDKPDQIKGTALAPLLDATTPTEPKPFDPVMPMPANAAQRKILHSAMTNTLTVATGPPGTGKSQLIVDVIATAVASGQSVLVASTNNGAVDEVWERCENLLPGAVIRTGSMKYRQHEVDGLSSLLAATEPNPNLRTCQVNHQVAAHNLDACRRKLANIGRSELALAEAAQWVHTASAVLDVPLSWRPAAPVAKARPLAGAWFFGELRRRRLLERAGLSDRPDTSSACLALADFAESVKTWERLSADSTNNAPDDELFTALQSAQQAGTKAAELVLRTEVHRRALDGRASIRALKEAKQSNAKSWRPFRQALPHVRGWAVSCLSAGHLPLDPGLFDLVIIDEASQCAIPYVVPLLFRARRALIVGDPMQLRHITKLTSPEDAKLRNAHGIGAAWADERCLSPLRYSAYQASERAAGRHLMLDEHFRCHPQIAEVSNRLFYDGALNVLTDVRRRPALDGPAIRWADVIGQAERAPSGGSWRNSEEVASVLDWLAWLLSELPTEAKIGVVTPYAAQSQAVQLAMAPLGDHLRERVRVGTAHTFQGGERDVMIMSLVAGRNVNARRFDWFDRQPQLWNVAITRARSNLIVVGDRELWLARGGVGAELATAGVGYDATSVPRDELHDHFYRWLSMKDPGFTVGYPVNGHQIDAVLQNGTGVLLDPGAGDDPALHIERMLRRRNLISTPRRSALRLPRWRLDAECL